MSPLNKMSEISQRDRTVIRQNKLIDKLRKLSSDSLADKLIAEKELEVSKLTIEYVVKYIEQIQKTDQWRTDVIHDNLVSMLKKQHFHLKKYLEKNIKKING